MVTAALTGPAPMVKLDKTGDVKLTVNKRLFGIHEQPSLNLKIGKSLDLSWLGIGTAAAAENIRTEVRYNDKKVDVPARIVPRDFGYEISLSRTPETKAGKYSLTAIWGSGPEDSATQSFAWGVLSVNTTQPAYLSEDTAHIQMAVLSSAGHTLCAAPVTLTVYDPAGKSVMPMVHNSPKCKGDTYITEPDYSAEYKVGGVGHYRMVLRMAESDYSLESGFDVMKNLPFVILRTAPTRLFPPATYENTISVTPQEDFRGKIQETLPDGFTASNIGQGGEAAGTMIAWQADWRAGVTYGLTYSFKSPPQSPAFYTLPRLKFLAESGKNYTEPRGWQMAGDAAIAFVQDWTGAATSSAVGVSLLSSSTTGNLLVATIGIDTSAVAVSSVTDTASNTWSLAKATTGGTGTRSEIWYAQDATAITTITINMPSSQTVMATLSEFSGVSPTAAFDASNGQANASSTSAGSSAVTTAATGELVVAMVSWRASNSYTSPGGSWTDLSDPGFIAGKQAPSAYRVAATAGSYSATWTLSTAAISSGNIVAFAPDPGGGGGPAACGTNPIAFVKQTAVNITTAASSDLNRSLTSTAGHALIMFYQTDSTSIRLSTVTDNGGNSWVVPAAPPSQNPPQNVSSSVTSGIAYALDINATTTISVTMSATRVFSYTVVEFSGIAATSAVDQAASASDSATTGHTTPGITTTNANNLLIGAIANSTDVGAINQGGSTPSSGWTQLTGNSGGAGAGFSDAAWKVVSATGTYSAAFTFATSHTAAMSIMAFKQEPGIPVTMDMVMRGGKAFCNGVEGIYFWAT